MPPHNLHPLSRAIFFLVSYSNSCVFFKMQYGCRLLLQGADLDFLRVVSLSQTSIPTHGTLGVLLCSRVSAYWSFRSIWWCL